MALAVTSLVADTALAVAVSLVAAKSYAAFTPAVVAYVVVDASFVYELAPQLLTRLRPTSALVTTTAPVRPFTEVTESVPSILNHIEFIVSQWM